MKQEAEIQQKTDIFQKAIDLAKENQRLAQEREQAEHQIKSLAKFCLENPNPVFRIGEDGKLLYANSPAFALLDNGATKIGDQIPPEFKKMVTHTLFTQSIQKNETKVGTQTFHLEWVPILSEGYVSIYGRDITDRKNLEKKLWSNEQRFRAISESSPVGIFQIDGDDFYIYFNTRWQVITKRTMKDSLGHKWWEIIHPGDKELVFEYWAKCEKGKETFSLDCRILRPDGEVVRCQIKASFFYDDYGKTTIGTIEEISARR